MDGVQEAEERKEGDLILELAIQCVQDGTYPPSLSKDKKRAVRKRAATLYIDKGEVFLNHGVCVSTFIIITVTLIFITINFYKSET